MKVATVFSGIGAPEYAIRRIPGVQLDIVFACDCGETKPLSEEVSAKLHEIRDPKERQHAVKTEYAKIRKKHWVKDVYFANYEENGITEDKWHDDIRFIDGNQYRGEVDLFIGGSPCQSFSNMGKRGGLEDARGTLFYDYARLISEMQPKAFIYENVPGMLAHDKGETWKTIESIFASLGYQIVMKEILNSADYGIPQNRKRLFVVGIKDINSANLFQKPIQIPLNSASTDYLETWIPAKYYMKKLGFRFTTTNTARAKINEPIIRTEKRNQQCNWNGDFTFETVDSLAASGRHDVMGMAYIGTYQGQRGVVRKLTPRECHNLMGFGKDFSICSNDTQAYKQSGNSIVVEVVQAVVEAILRTGAI